MTVADRAFFAQPFLALAHRGGSTYPPNVGRENTLHAFGEAVALGYTHVETDVHATRDGVLLAFHDDRLDRVTDRTGMIADLTFAQVTEARIGGTDPIPTLDQVFETFPETFFNIDLKSDAAIEPLVEALNRHHAQQRVNVASFSDRTLRTFRRLAGTQVSTSVAPSGIRYTRLLPSVAGLLAAPGNALQVPHWHPLPQAVRSLPPLVLEALGDDIDVRGERFRVVTRALVDAAHAAGKVVHVWTIDDADEMRELIDLGVDGLVSDRIDVLKDVLVERGRWHDEH
ncbi:glycerophosphoryl diester phosphodiesterase [Raineyella antarctica]|uniref:Glycerophosphoryl diester phosphodiesterase n=1 Tax=Raineyella antarctica TaxID=1577474 RepID=A0A1G6GM04_9ACTN|nr:glycerophosphodiester phosphodiesterase family protein [Raineyella antarctica]SDB83007.1 glycerophosphoryl diester phosphodiesterase [Raineyella antarctica]